MPHRCRHKARLVHAWAGLVLSLILVVLGVSGTLLVFESDYLRATIPASRQAIDYDASNIGAAVEKIERQARAADSDISYVTLAQDNLALHRVDFQDGGAAYTDQSGNIVKNWGENGSIEDWIFKLHHYLFLGNTGKNIAGVAGFAALVMVMTGLIIVMPFLRDFSWRIWPRSTRRRALLGVHRDLGVLFVIPVILLTFTGAAMVFSKPVNVLLAAVTASTPVPFETPVVGSGSVDWTRAISKASTEFPDARLRLVSWPRAAGAPVSIRLRQPEEWHQNGRTYVYVDPATSDVVARRDALRLSRGERAFNVLYPLHSAGIGGRLYDVLVGLTGLTLALLGAIGSWTFLAQRRRLRDDQTAQPPVSVRTNQPADPAG